MLCTVMVLVTWSVMGGFLRVLLDSGRTLIGDVSIVWPNTGFAYYEDLVARLEADKKVAAAAPIIESFGLLGLPDGRTPSVMIKGIDPERYNKVTGFYDTLWWRPIEKPLEKDVEKRDPRLVMEQQKGWERILDNGKRLVRADPPGWEEKPAVNLGIEASGFNSRQPSGIYIPHARDIRTDTGDFDIVRDFLPDRGNVTVHVLPLDKKGRGVDMVTRSFPVANEFKTGVFQFDKQMVVLPLDELQRMLKMDKAKRIADKGAVRPQLVKDPKTGEERFVIPGADDPSKLVEDPARVTTVLVRAAPGVSAEELKQHVMNVIYPEFEKAHRGLVPSALSIDILTWEDLNATFIGAVKKETALVLFLFTIISFVAVFLVLAIFWSMVSEKTKDIGVLRSLGAGRLGVAGMWLTYGLAIGLVGSLFGGIASYFIITNINPIHEWLGSALGIAIWDPRIYYFTKIPNQIDPSRAAIVLVSGVLSSVLGAVVPAARAALMDPVKALRFE
jgi:lipoprotein-releasing system permease protein